MLVIYQILHTQSTQHFYLNQNQSRKSLVWKVLASRAKQYFISRFQETKMDGRLWKQNIGDLTNIISKCAILTPLRLWVCTLVEHLSLLERDSNSDGALVNYHLRWGSLIKCKKNCLAFVKTTLHFLHFKGSESSWYSMWLENITKSIKAIWQYWQIYCPESFIFAKVARSVGGCSISGASSFKLDEYVKSVLFKILWFSYVSSLPSSGFPKPVVFDWWTWWESSSRRVKSKALPDATKFEKKALLDVGSKWWASSATFSTAKESYYSNYFKFWKILLVFKYW